MFREIKKNFNTTEQLHVALLLDDQIFAAYIAQIIYIAFSLG